MILIRRWCFHAGWRISCSYWWLAQQQKSRLSKEDQGDNESLHYKLFKGAGAFEMGNVFVDIRDTRSYIFTKGMILLITLRTILRFWPLLGCAQSSLTPSVGINKSALANIKENKNSRVVFCSAVWDRFHCLFRISLHKLHRPMNLISICNLKWNK